MPYAVAHILSAGIAADLIREYIIKKHHKKFITLSTILIAAIASLVPDIDIVAKSILGFFGKNFAWLYHGSITHTLFFGLLSIKFTQLFLLEKMGLSAAAFDAVLLISWLIYEIKTRRLREFI